MSKVCLKNEARPMRLRVGSPGFTLIEILVTLGILGILMALSLGAVKSVFRKGQLAKELAIGRATYTAFVSAAADRTGVYLAGFGLDEPGQVVVDADGRNLGPLIGSRYPYRLGPYLDFAMNKLVTPEVDKLASKQADPAYVYSASPSFGINYWMFGGDRSTGTLRYSNDCIARVAQADRPIIAFTTAASGTGDSKLNGYFRITPPVLSIPNWKNSAWSKSSNPSSFGFVDARHEGRAICVFSDGSSRLLKISELQDMRLWSKRALELDDPNYVPTL